MHVYCVNEFRVEFDKIRKNKKYPDLTPLFKDFFFNKPFNEVATGDRLYGPDEIPLLKKRVPNAERYRFYFFAVPSSECIYLSFIHPKVGPYGSPNITNDYKAEMHKRVLGDIKSGKLMKVTICPTTNDIIYT